ncbi:MAG: response regulator [Oscillospiraceae bacterium]|jgi:putative two-component system response regulator|nr:response regulator [Oscillospiraceae bacterium]
MMRNDGDIILVVDDLEINRVILCNMLQDDCRIVEAASGREALKILLKDKLRPAVVLLDVMMPDIDGFQVLEQMRLHRETQKIPVLFITAADTSEDESRGLKAGAVDYITKPFNLDIVQARVKNHIELSRYQNELESLVAKKAAEVTKTYESTLEVLATIIEYRSLETGGHIRRTTLLTETLLRRMLTEETFSSYLLQENINSMIKASALHDIGKIGITDAILLKPEKLTRDEFEIIKSHTTIGNEIIDNIASTLPDNDMYLKHAQDICHYHHERWDGSGYPCGLSGIDIPISARTISIVDVYDALVSPRCYKDAFSHERSLRIILDGSGSQFDPVIVSLLPSLSADFRAIAESYRD